MVANLRNESDLKNMQRIQDQISTPICGNSHELPEYDVVIR